MTSLLRVVLLICLARIAVADPIDDYVRGEMRTHGIPGATLVVLKNGKVLKEQQFGLANIELSVPVSRNSVYPIASITKVFTATAVLLLIREHKLQLDTKLLSVMPDLPGTWRGVTIQNLLTHTSGIPEIPEPNYSPIPLAATQAEALKQVEALPLAYQPGERSDYNDTEYLLAKMIIEKLSGTTYESFMAERIFRPLGMNSARFGDSRDVVANKVTLYTHGVPADDRFDFALRDGHAFLAGDKLWETQLLYPAYTDAFDGMQITADDFARFDAALWSGSLLASEQLQRMIAPVHLKSGVIGDFTAGLQTQEIGGRRIVFHIGAGMVEYVHVPENGLSIIWLTNCQARVPQQLIAHLLDFYSSEPPGKTGPSGAKL